MTNENSMKYRITLGTLQMSRSTS